MVWKLVYYETKKGNKPIQEFIEHLAVSAQAKVVNALNLLEEFGIYLGMPRVKKLTGTPLWELRILGKDSIRIMYVARDEKKLLLLHCFLKKRRKTDKKEIKIAINRLAEFESRKIAGT